jgi:hypothetical protein
LALTLLWDRHHFDLGLDTVVGLAPFGPWAGHFCGTGTILTLGWTRLWGWHHLDFGLDALVGQAPSGPWPGHFCGAGTLLTLGWTIWWGRHHLDLALDTFRLFSQSRVSISDYVTISSIYLLHNPLPTSPSY